MRSKAKTSTFIPEYPCLMMSMMNGSIVLFYACGQGVVVGGCKTNSYEIGCHSDAWDMDCFVPFEGDVTLYS